MHSQTQQTPRLKRPLLYFLGAFLLLPLVAVLLGGALDDLTNAASDPESLFNGTDLSGWIGDPAFWRVEDGAIVGERTEEGRPSTYLYYDGPMVKDFTLTLDMRLSDRNSGIQYRSRLVDQYAVAGYQYDFDGQNRHTGGLYEQNGRGIVARRGQKVVLELDSLRNPVINETGSVGDYDELASHINTGDWNAVEITAVGNHLVHKINGHVTADITDNDSRRRALSGLLAIQLHSGPPMKVELKNIMLTRLPGTAASGQ